MTNLTPIPPGLCTQLADAIAQLDPTLFFNPELLDLLPEDFANGAYLVPTPDAIAWILRQIQDHIRNPILYADIIRQANNEQSRDLLLKFIIDRLHSEYAFLQITRTEDLLYGIPLRFLGCDPANVYFLEDEPDLAEIYTDFLPVRTAGQRGADHGRNYPEAYVNYQFIFAELDQAAQIAPILAHSLVRHPRAPYLHIAMALMWMFGFSGHPIVDMTLREWCENGNDWYEWNHEIFEHLRERFHQAQIMVEAGRKGIRFLLDNPDFRHVLRNNIQIARNIHSEGRTLDDLSLDWPGAGQLHLPGPWADPQTDPALLLLRNRRAEV